MLEEEKKLLLNIDILYSKLIDDSSEKLVGVSMKKPSGDLYRDNAENLKIAIIDLHNKFQPDYLSSQIFNNITYIYNKDVLAVVRYYDISRKNNHTKKSYSDFLNSINKANTQFELILITIQTKIKELKKD